MALIYNKGGIDKTVILAVREFVAQPFEAPQWLDLRIGFLLSITRADNDDNITNTPSPNIIETIGTDPVMLGWDDRYKIGLTDSATGASFLGYTNCGPEHRLSTLGSTKLVSSDIGVGTTNSNFYRPRNGNSNNYSALIIENSNVVLASSSDGVQQHFAQTLPGAGGYATLLMLRFTRPDADANAKRITMTIPMMATGHSADVLFTDTPTETLLRAQLQTTFPSPVMQFGPVTLSQVPDTFFLYWPFRNSRLRIHAMGFAKAL